MGGGCINRIFHIFHTFPAGAKLGGGVVPIQNRDREGWFPYKTGSEPNNY